MDFSNRVFRCSRLGDLMTEPKSKSEALSATAKAYLNECYIFDRFGREKDFKGKYIEKGLMVEELAIDHYSFVKGKFFEKNKERIHNDFISGEPDLYVGESILKATEIIDIKSSWDIFTFFDAINSTVNKKYFWQMQGYMWLTGAKKATLAYLLIDTPEFLINKEKDRLRWDMAVIDESTDADYIDACNKIDKSMRFADIPESERIFELEVVYSEPHIEVLKEKIVECRAYLNGIKFNGK